MPKSIRSRGFTLVELLVGAAVGAVVLLGISLTFISQAQQYQAHSSRRALQSNARLALGFMERHLRVAGYGVDPDRAVIPYDSYDAVSDTQVAGYPDAFVVHWRDELFRRTVLAADTAHIDINAPLITPMRRGQILMVICVSDPNPLDLSVNSNPPHVFVTVGQFVAAGSVTIPLDPTPPVSAPNSPILGSGRLFHEQAIPGFAHNCFTRQPPQVVLIHRAAFFVAMFDDDGNPATPERTPYLMMHQGLDEPAPLQPQGNGVIDADDAVPVAEGIEQLQVAYILDTNDEDVAFDAGDRSPIVLGVEELLDVNHYGENWEQINLGSLPHGWFFNPGYPRKLYNNPKQLAKKRLEDHPANIRQVRLTLISRSTVPDPQIEGDNLLLHRDGTPYPDGPAMADSRLSWRHLENLNLTTPAPDFAPSGGHYYRSILRQTIAPKNLLMNRQFVPVNIKGGG
jgi:type IV pilus assembly protein PilW